MLEEVYYVRARMHGREIPSLLLRKSVLNVGWIPFYGDLVHPKNPEPLSLRKHTHGGCFLALRNFVEMCYNGG